MGFYSSISGPKKKRSSPPSSRPLWTFAGAQRRPAWQFGGRPCQSGCPRPQRGQPPVAMGKYGEFPTLVNWKKGKPKNINQMASFLSMMRNLLETNIRGYLVLLCALPHSLNTLKQNTQVKWSIPGGLPQKFPACLDMSTVLVWT